MTSVVGKRKKDGFEGQKSIVIPRKILNLNCGDGSIVGALFITDIGYYPKAKFHYRERLHGAEQHILIYCIDGKGSVRIGASEYSIKPGDFIIAPKNVSHTYASDEADPWTIYWIHFKGCAADDIVALAQKRFEGHKGFVHFNESRNSVFSNMYMQLERGYSSDNIVYANMCLWQYLTTFIFQEKFNLGHKNSTYDAIDRAIDFMSDRIDQVINLEEIAQSVNLSASHFSSLFKKKTGFSPIDYFNHLKIQKACKYLLFSDLRVKEIAFKLGIDDQYYFSRMFSKVMGMSPNEYRREKYIKLAQVVEE